jgi:hypothetical protein
VKSAARLLTAIQTNPKLIAGKACSREVSGGDPGDQSAEGSSVRWAAGKIKDQKGLLLVSVSEAGVIAIPPKKLKHALLDSGIDAVASALTRAVVEKLGALGVINFDLADAAESAAGGGLLGMAVGAAVGGAQEAAEAEAEAAIHEAVTLSLEKLLGAGQVSEEEVLKALAHGEPVVHVPSEKLKRISGGTTGMISKSYELKVVEKGWWFFNTTHEFVFRKKMMEQAAALPEAARPAA